MIARRRRVGSDLPWDLGDFWDGIAELPNFGGLPCWANLPGLAMRCGFWERVIRGSFGGLGGFVFHRVSC